MLKNPVTADDHIQGDPNAPVVLVEYGDYECPHCGHAHPIVKRVQKHFGDQLGFVFRNFPLNEAHPHAQIAAETAEFAGLHGLFWEMHDQIFENQSMLSRSALLAMAESLGLPSAELDAALTSHQHAARVRHDFMGGVHSGVNGTPTFFINGQRHDGPFEFEDLVAAIEARFT
ncbi:DsbA family protein [Fimbriiglobus ruber]|uniref:Periplasmic thiol:disulfide interchange protein DsbA n=1 Tax=Fimbriiglobus ruber TaxID=1908690 RepID=A0A225D2M5_9BACT|nr:DsbA family protein [Fimbriiglobus ruber]OWK35840.1 Periplasmic thiol:disulfide interchange protein DsbA [Fimbriiglobus ruber]